MSSVNSGEHGDDADGAQRERGPPIMKQTGSTPMAWPTAIAAASAGRLTRLPADEAGAGASGAVDTCDIARLESKKA